MNQVADPVLAKRSKRRPLLWGACTFVVAVLAVLGWFGYRWLVDDWALREVIAEADRVDPGWRLAELDAKRSEVPDEQNGAVQVMAAAQLIPVRWPQNNFPGPSFAEVIQRLPPETPLDQTRLDSMRAAMGQVTEALGPALRLAKYPTGRHSITWSRDGIGTLLPHAQSARNVAELLTMHALLRAHDGDVDGALAACRACLNAGRSLGDEPAGISQLVRLGCRGLALHALERTLAQGEPSESTLSSLQQLLEDEADQPVLLIMARADRAIIHQALEAIKSGEFDRRGFALTNPFGLPDQALNWVDAGKARSCQAALLRFGTRIVEIAKLPPDEQLERLQQLTEPDVDKPSIFRIFGEWGWLKSLGTYWNSQALLKCGITALAAERFRQAKGRWPEKLQELVPDYLRAVPADPFDGKELRFRQLADGIVIYTLGPDGRDNGGTLSRLHLPPPETDIGFRLWNPAQRRRPPEKSH
jgi:hypothetical protein